jgi:diguanylate cyclase (GGDEF)-like protein
MSTKDVKFILAKNARILYFDRTSTLEELESIKEDIKRFNQGYEIFRQGIISSVKGNLTKAIIKCDEAIKHGYQHNDGYLIQEISAFLGVVYRSLGHLEDALIHYLNALKYSNSPRVYNNIADIYLLIGDFEEAKTYLKRAENILSNQKELSIFDERLFMIILSNMSEADIKAGHFEDGILNARKSLEMASKVNDVFTEAYGQLLLGCAYMEKEDFHAAITHLERSYDIYLSCDPYSQNRVFDYIEDNKRTVAECYSRWGKYEDSNDRLFLIENWTAKDYELLIKNYRQIGNHEEAYNYAIEFLEYRHKEEEKAISSKVDHFKSKIQVFETEKKANDYEVLYTHTKSVSNIGKEIISAEKLDDVLHALEAHIDKIMAFNSLALAKVEGDSINYKWVLENHERTEGFKVQVDSQNSFSSWVVRNKKSIRLNDALTGEELKKYKAGSTMVYGHAMDSMVLCPIMYKDEVFGLINVQSSERYTYTEADLEVIKMLSSFVGIAMKNWDDTRQLKLMNEKLEQLSKTDALTGISNRHVLSEIVEDIFRADSTENKKISVVMIDIDHFKEYNDTYGHIDGDRCIVKIVDALREKLDQESNRLFRYGGDEFVALVPFIESNAVQEMLESIRGEIEGLMIENKRSKVSDYVTCSFGYTTFTKGQGEYQRAFYLADEALYMAKANGKNCVAYKKT